MNDHLALAAEIAARLAEMEEAAALSSLAFIKVLARLGDQSPGAYRLAIDYMHNGPRRFLSFGDLAQQDGISRQAAHKRFMADVARIRAVLPDAAAQILAMRAATHAGHGNSNQTHGTAGSTPRPPAGGKESFSGQDA